MNCLHLRLERVNWHVGASRIPVTAQRDEKNVPLESVLRGYVKSIIFVYYLVRSQDLFVTRRNVEQLSYFAYSYPGTFNQSCDCKPD